MRRIVIKRPKILEVLIRSEDPAADQAIAAGLPLLGSDEQCRFVDLLVTRSREGALEILPELFDRLTPEAQARLVQHTGHLFSALRSTVRSANLQTRLNSLNIIRRSRNPRLAYLAAACVHDGSHHIRGEAAHTLLELTELHCTNYADTTDLLRDACDGDSALTMPIIQTLRMMRDERQQLVAAIRETLSHFESHHRPEVLAAAMYLAHELEDALFSEGILRRGKLNQAMLEIFTTTPSPRLAAFTYIALRYPELRRRIVSVLSNLRDPAFFAEVIRHHWLARDPSIREHLAAIRSLVWLADGFEAAFTLPAGVAAMAPQWIASLGLASDQKVRLLQNFLLIDNPAANRAAVWELTRIHTPAGNLALQGAADHDEPAIRRLADLECRHRRRVDSRQVRQVRRNRPDEWCDLLDKSGLNEDFDSFWTGFERIPPHLATAGGLHALKFINGFQTQIQVKLIAQHPADRARALKMLIDLGLTERYCKEIFSAANDSISEVRGLAMRALGHLGDGTSRRILERALSDPDAAVQAATIEALDHIGSPKRAELFQQKTQSPSPEVRAAAIAALLRMHVPAAAMALVAMLKDERSEHRSSALSVVEQLNLHAIGPRVAEMAATDPDERVARIAQHLQRRLKRTKSDRTGKNAANAGASPLSINLHGGISL